MSERGEDRGDRGPSKGLPFALPVLTAERFGRLWLVGLLLVFGTAFLWMVRFFVTPVILAAVIAVLAWPLQRWLSGRFGGREGVAALISVILLVAGVIVPLYVVFGLVRLEIVRIYETIEGPLGAWLSQAGMSMAEAVRSWEDTDLGRLLLSEPLRGLGIAELDLAGSAQQVVRTAGNLAARVVNRTSSGAFQLLANLFVVLFTLFYFFRDGEAIVARLRYLSPLDERYEELLVDRLISISRATLRGSLILGGIQGGIGALTLWLTGVQAPVLWGMVMLLLSVVPLLGTWLVMYPIGIVQILLGNVWEGVAILVVTVGLISNIDNVLRPRLVGRGSGLHDLIIFFSTLGGIAVFGVMGFIVGPILAAVTLALIEIYSLEFKAQLERTQRGPASQILAVIENPEIGEDPVPESDR